ncbi:MAG: polyhydroxyalkanoic acid system family protein [Erythrobacter sp.]|uniref:polyhydroxyalkanoic acid system family protein n=1 Tax=Erythrobacter sp. HL-111 TaxID=1798193 RepID=UPI0006DAEA5A|nr:polyhydroxyalkanoic acid system family protein [Erythrobacter sp. HL-111]KPP86740.1 MAG: putative polyhydroxyalkanoic acid system protein [Erythrobacteraceae bacterium HL-111]SDS98487.1 Putative polyhydroxyalkanoic acid system protein (PHA_gran_rgn) [Erythrobacter sp. HL-111]
MRVSLPHNLGREEVRRRLHERQGEIAHFFPPGMASLDTSWQGEDHMDMVITIVGQHLRGAIDIHETSVTIEMELPLALSFLRGTIERAMKKEGARLLR